MSNTYNDAMWALNEIVSAHKAGSPVVRMHLNEIHEMLIEYHLIGAVRATVEQDDGSRYWVLIPTRAGVARNKSCRRTWVQEIEECSASSSND